MNAMRVISFEKLCAIHNQIYRQLGKYLNYFRYDLKVDISYDKYRQTYYYDGEDLFSVLETTLFHKK